MKRCVCVCVFYVCDITLELLNMPPEITWNWQSDQIFVASPGTWGWKFSFSFFFSHRKQKNNLFQKMAEIWNLSWNSFILWYNKLWYKFVGQIFPRTCSPTDCPTRVCHTTVFTTADSYVVSRQEPSSNPQIPRREWHYFSEEQHFLFQKST